MRELVSAYLSKQLSRRRFVSKVTEWGLSLAAANALVESFTPMLHAESLDASTGSADGLRMVEGTGGELLVEQLRAAGVRFIFNCSSSTTYPVFDALLDRSDMQVIQVPQEGQMIAVAQGYALASRQLAFTLNDSAGFPNTLNNMYNAWKDCTPLVIASQRESTNLLGGRYAHEEWDDFLSPSSSFTRWRWSIERAERIPEITRRAFAVATTPPEGPVTLAFPSDTLAAGGVKAGILDQRRFLFRAKLRPNARVVEDAARLLLQAERPLIIVGPEVTRSDGRDEVVRLAERLAIPVAQGDLLFDDFPHPHPLFVGNLTPQMEYPPNVDLVINIGSRMPPHDDVLPARAKVIHLTIDAEQIGRIVPTDVGMVGDVKDAVTDWLAALESGAMPATLDQRRAARFDATKAYTDKLSADRARRMREKWNDSLLHSDRIAAELDQRLEKDAIIVPELAYGSWMRQFTFGPHAKRRIGKTTGSALGWGVGAALGVKLAQPDRQVVALQGDGGFMFGQAESLWTMARYEVPVIVIIFNNRSYNGPRNRILQSNGHQARAGREMTSYLGDPDVDFAKVAAGFGVKGETVSVPGQLPDAITRALESTREGEPYLIDALVARTGLGADSTWHPHYSVAARRTRKV